MCVCVCTYAHSFQVLPGPEEVAAHSWGSTTCQETYRQHNVRQKEQDRLAEMRVNHVREGLCVAALTHVYSKSCLIACCTFQHTLRHSVHSNCVQCDRIHLSTCLSNHMQERHQALSVTLTCDKGRNSRDRQSSSQ